MTDYPHNPLLDNHIFVPDAEARVFSDGRIYLYGSFDIMGEKQYCSDVYHVYSSDDMIHWTDHGVSFSLADTIAAKDAGALYAPDCIFRNGKYYLYYCVPDGRCGVAVSDVPYGPFRDLGIIENVKGIDPAVFIDDDSNAYLYWGQFDNVRAARLLGNMTEIDLSTLTQPLNVADFEFHEGSSVRKINGRYYYVFTDTHRHGGKATCLGYAVSDNPLTGFEYKGIIIDNYGCDPDTWNNHGSLQYFNGSWYVFYHRSTHASYFSRHVCAEKLEFLEDGTIKEARMTSSGPGEYICAGDVIPACLACSLTGNVRIASSEESDNILVLDGIKPGDSALFRYIKFSNENEITLNMNISGKCELKVFVNGVKCSERCLTGNGKYESYSAPVKAPEGKCDLKFEFSGDFTVASLDYFTFG